MDTDILLTFAGTHHAIAAEQALLGCGVAVRVMPLPGAIAAGCGLCLRVARDSLDAATACLNTAGVQVQNLYDAGSYAPHKTE